ncbi:MAG: insulinase family protein, partial [Candidatus Aminicenantes bacterium]
MIEGMNNQRRILPLFLTVVFLLALTALPGPAWSQNPAAPASAQADKFALDQKMPVDPKITVGELSNGLRYYIRENREPANRAELHLVVNAGSVLEDDDQLGLAHVVEHMAFNGSKHFPKQKLV